MKKWYTVQVRSNMEKKFKESLENLLRIEDMGEYISASDILMPVETVLEVKNGKKREIERKLYPGYIFLKMKLFDEDDNFLEKPWYFIKSVNGAINFLGGERPLPLRDSEILEVINNQKKSEGVVKPKIDFNINDHVKIKDGPFMNLTGVVEEVDADKGKIKVSVSIFGRFTPVELECGQAEKVVE